MIFSYRELFYLCNCVLARAIISVILMKMEMSFCLFFDQLSFYGFWILWFENIVDFRLLFFGISYRGCLIDFVILFFFWRGVWWVIFIPSVFKDHHHPIDNNNYQYQILNRNILLHPYMHGRGRDYDRLLQFRLFL